MLPASFSVDVNVIIMSKAGETDRMWREAEQKDNYEAKYAANDSSYVVSSASMIRQQPDSDIRTDCL